MKNKSIIRAMAIGISASMALQPLTVFAEGQDAEPVSENNTDSVDAAAEAVETDTAAIAGDVNGEDGVKEAVSAVSEQKKDNVAPTTHDNINNIENASGKLSTEVTNITSDADTLKQDADNVQQTDAAADTKINELNAVKTNIETLTSDTEDKMEEAVERLEGTNEKIAGAATAAEANNIYEEAKAVADDANKVYAAAAENYNTLKGQYEDALSAAETARANYNAALTQTGTDIAKAKADLDRAESAANTLYNQAQQALNEVNGTKALVNKIGNSQIRIAEKNVTTARNDVTKAQNAFDQAEKAYNDAFDHYNNLGKEIENTKKAIAENAGDIVVLSAELAKKEAEYLKAGNDLKTANGRKTAIEKELKNANTELERAKNNKAAAEAAQKIFDTISSSLSGEIDGLEKWTEAYKNNYLASANSAAGSAKTTMGEKKGAYEGLVTSEGEARGAVTSKEAEITKLSDDIDALGKEISTLATTVEGELANKSALEEEATNLEEAAAALETTRKDAETSLDNIIAAEGKLTEHQAKQAELNKLNDIKSAVDKVKKTQKLTEALEVFDEVEKCEALAKKLIKYKLESENNTNVNIVETEDFSLNSDNNYIAVKYVDKDGMEHTEYYDFVMQYTDWWGNVKQAFNHVDYASVDRITVVKKNYRINGRGEVVFNGKGDNFISTSDYEQYLSKISALSTDVSGFDATEQENIIKDQKYNKTEAQAILDDAQYSEAAISKAQTDASYKRGEADQAATTYTNLSGSLKTKQGQLENMNQQLGVAQQAVAELKEAASIKADELSNAETEYKKAQLTYIGLQNQANAAQAYYEGLLVRTGVKKLQLVGAQQAAKFAKDEADKAAKLISEKELLVKTKSAELEDAKAIAKIAEDDYFSALRERNQVQSTLADALVKEARLSGKLVTLEANRFVAAWDAFEAAGDYAGAASRLGNARSNLKQKETTLKNLNDQLEILNGKYAQALAAYNNLKVAAEAAKNDVDKAQADVAALEAKIAQSADIVVTDDGVVDLKAADIAQIKSDYEKAKKELENAETLLEEINAAASEAKETLDNTVAEIRRRQQAMDQGSFGSNEGTSTGSNNDEDDVVYPAAITRGSAALSTASAADDAAVLGATRAASSGKSSKAAAVNAKASTSNDTAANTASNANGVNENKDTVNVDATKTIGEESTALAATPIEAKKGFPYWVLIILAGIAGVSVEEYIRRKNNKDIDKA